jgi:3-hydroxyacyl-CoA dehydrogenase
LDVALAVLEHLYEAFGEKFKPCSILVEKVKNGQLGIKTRKGFYEYQTSNVPAFVALAVR